MTPERIKLRLPDSPRGERLQEETIDKARNALIRTYPLFESDEFKLVLPSESNVFILPQIEIEEIESEQKPRNDNLMYQALTLCGVPEERLEIALLQSKRLERFTDSTSTPKYYISTRITKDLYEENPERRLLGASNFAQSLIDEFMKIAPKPRTLPKYPWSVIFANMIENDTFLDIENQTDGVNSARLLEAKDMLVSITDEAEFIARGATVSMVVSGQSYLNPEIIYGTDFNWGVSLLLRRGVEQKLFNSLNNIFFKSGHWLTSEPPHKSQQTSEQICFRAGFTISQNPDLQDDNLIESYLDSNLPNHIFWGRNNQNAFSYPK